MVAATCGPSLSSRQRWDLRAVLQVHRAQRGAAVERGYMALQYCRALALRSSSRDVAERFAVYAFPAQTHDLTSACEQVEGASSVVSFAPLGGSGRVALARRGAFAPLASARGLWWPLAGFSGPPRLPSMEPSMDRPWLLGCVWLLAVMIGRPSASVSFVPGDDSLGCPCPPAPVCREPCLPARICAGLRTSLFTFNDCDLSFWRASVTVQEPRGLADNVEHGHA